QRAPAVLPVPDHPCGLALQIPRARPSEDVVPTRSGRGLEFLRAGARRTQQQRHERGQQDHNDQKQAFSARPLTAFAHDQRARTAFFLSQQAQGGARLGLVGRQLRILLADAGHFVLEFRAVKEESRAVPQAAQVAAFEQPALERFRVANLNHARSRKTKMENRKSAGTDGTGAKAAWCRFSFFVFRFSFITAPYSQIKLNVALATSSTVK